MRIDGLVVESGREDHIARHGVTLDEVFQVAIGDPAALRVREGRIRVVGQTSAGRYLTVIVGIRSPGIFGLITARDATDAERRFYRSQGRR